MRLLSRDHLGAVKRVGSIGGVKTYVHVVENICKLTLDKGLELEMSKAEGMTKVYDVGFEGLGIVRWSMPRDVPRDTDKAPR